MVVHTVPLFLMLLCQRWLWGNTAIAKVEVGVGDYQRASGLTRGNIFKTDDIAACTQVAHLIVIDQVAPVVGGQDFERQSTQVAIRCQDPAGTFAGGPKLIKRFKIAVSQLRRLMEGR